MQAVNSASLSILAQATTVFPNHQADQTAITYALAAPILTIAKSVKDMDPLQSLKQGDWYAFYIETVDIMTCEFHVLNDAFINAPTDAAAGYIRAIYEVRARQAAIQDVEFAWVYLDGVGSSTTVSRVFWNVSKWNFKIT